MASPSHRPRWAEQGARPGALLTTCSHPTLRPWSFSGGELVPRQADLPALGALTAPGLVGAGSPAGEAGCGPHQPPPLPGSPMAATCEISNVFSNYFSTMYSSDDPTLASVPPAPTFGADDLVLALGSPQMALEGTGGSQEGLGIWGESLGQGRIRQGAGWGVGTWGYLPGGVLAPFLVGGGGTLGIPSGRQRGLTLDCAGPLQRSPAG